MELWKTMHKAGMALLMSSLALQYDIGGNHLVAAVACTVFNVNGIVKGVEQLAGDTTE